MSLSVLTALGLMAQTVVGKMAVVRTFATSDEIGHLTKANTDWDATMPCADPGTTSQIDLILVYSKDIGMHLPAKAAVEAYEASFAQGKSWTGCFAGIKNMSARLVEEEDQYDEQGYAMNKHWVTGPNMVFMRSMEAFYTGDFVGEYSTIFWMEIDAVPVMSNWLDKFQEEAAEMPARNLGVKTVFAVQPVATEQGAWLIHLLLLLLFLVFFPSFFCSFLLLLARNMAIRGSLYFGSNWQSFAHMMPDYILKHINGNWAMLKPLTLSFDFLK